MAGRLGIATGRSLAVNIREHFPKPVSAFLGLTVVIACVATDVAELQGSAIGFQLLFGLPLYGPRFMADALFGSVSRSLKHHIRVPLLLLRADL